MNSLARRIMTQAARRPPARPARRGVVPGPAVHAAHHMHIEPGIGAGIRPGHALIASDGAMIPATGPGVWDQLVSAGRIR